MIISSAESLYAKHLDLCMRIKKDYQPLPNTTLNEKFELLIDQQVPAGDYPSLNYIVLGIGGDTVVTNNDYKFSRHRSTDAALFQHVPLIIRTVGNDLLPAEQAKYRLRVLENINGTDYICYYMKIFDGYLMRDEVYQINADTEFQVLTTYDTNSEDILNPLPRDISDPVDIINNKYVAVTCKIDFILTTTELTELENAMTIKFGSVSKLTEIGLCSGYDYDNAGITESIATLINYFITIDLDTSLYLAQNTPIARSIEIGGSEILQA